MIVPVQRAPLRILLVEDNEHDRIAFRRSLGREGTSLLEKSRSFEIEECERGEEALRRLSTDPSTADIVVVDYDLPGMTGLELFTELKDQVGEMRTAPFVMLTGAGTEELAARAIKAGIYDYLVKDPEDRYLRLLSTVLVSAYKQHQQRLAYLDAQRQLAAAHRELEGKVAQRTRELRHTVRSLKDEVSVRMKTERSLRESRRSLRSLSLKAIEAQENERKAIAQDLHDGIGGNLSAIKMNIEERIGKMADPPAEDGISLETIVGYLKETIAEVRRISARLRPKDLDSLGLKGALRQSCRRVEQQYPGVGIVLSLDVAEADIPDFLKLVIYRIAQEALGNSARHASAKTVRLSLAKNRKIVHLSVEDDGCGFDPEKIAAAGKTGSGYGLKGMHDRAELNEGTLRIESAPGAGTRICAEFPLAGSEAEPPGGA